MHKIGLVTFIMVALACSACSKKNAQSLLDDYDSIVKAECEYVAKCVPMLGETVEDCLEFERQKSIPTFTSCPNYFKVTDAIEKKCTLELAKKYTEDDDTCPKRKTSPEETAKQMAEMIECKQSYDISEIQKCACEHLDELPDHSAAAIRVTCFPEIGEIIRDCMAKAVTPEQKQRVISCYCEHVDEIKNDKQKEIMKKEWCTIAEQLSLQTQSEKARQISMECDKKMNESIEAMRKCRCENADELALGNKEEADKVRKAFCN